MDDLPNDVRFIRLGQNGRWARTSLAKGELHAGWLNVPDEALLTADREACGSALLQQFASSRSRYTTESARKGAATRDFNALMDLLEKPEQFVWVTIVDGHLWWCTVHRGITINPEGEDMSRGHIWLRCNWPWSRRSLKGHTLAIADLPGPVGVVAAFRATVARPKHAADILRIIGGERSADREEYDRARNAYKTAIAKIVTQLHWRDLELLIDLILARGGWVRVASLGKTQETVDIEAEHPESGERILVQIKASASARVLADYVKRWKKTDHDRLVFVAASAEGDFPTRLPQGVHVWTRATIAELAVARGLGDWIAKRAS